MSKIKIINNYGILASMSWNSNKWADNPTEDDAKRSKYGYIKDNSSDKSSMVESINFGHEIYPPEQDGYYIGFTPKSPAIGKSKNVCIVFFNSTDYKNSNKKSIVGFYGYPKFGKWYHRKAKHDLYKKYPEGNIKAFPKNIVYFENPVEINNNNVHENKLLPVGRKISRQGFNYLNSENVYNIMKIALLLNKTNKKLKSFVEQFPLRIKLEKAANDLSDFITTVGNTDADTINGIKKLEKKMKKQSPEVKQRISTFIERGAIANKIKKITNYKCLICEAQGLNPYSFKKPNGMNYVETHHVEPVSTLKEGVLSVSNLITVCANHHR